MNPDSTMSLSEAALPERLEIAAVSTAVGAPLRIVLVDDHPVVREGLKKLIAAQPDMEVVGEAQDGDEAFKAAVQLSPDVIVLDLVMPHIDGLEAARQIKRSCPQIKIIGLSISEDTSYITDLVGAGAEGFVVKRAAADELVAAIRVVQKGGIHLDPRVQGSLLQARIDDAQHPKVPLTPREEAIIKLIAKGHTNREIASLLDLSVKTVETYKARAMEKTGLRNRVEIVRHGANRGWLHGDEKKS